MGITFDEFKELVKSDLGAEWHPDLEAGFDDGKSWCYSGYRFSVPTVSRAYQLDWEGWYYSSPAGYGQGETLQEAQENQRELL